MFYFLLKRPQGDTLDLNKYIFLCDFETDYCGLVLFGTWYRGRNTQTENTGPDSGASNSRTFFKNVNAYFFSFLHLT